MVRSRDGQERAQRSLNISIPSTWEVEVIRDLMQPGNEYEEKLRSVSVILQTGNSSNVLECGDEYTSCSTAPPQEAIKGNKLLIHVNNMGESSKFECQVTEARLKRPQTA